MTDRCLVLHEGLVAVRVRREPLGCIMFDSFGTFVQGNKTVWEIFELIARGAKYDELVCHFSETYGLPSVMIDNDLKELFLDFRKYGWLTSFDIGCQKGGL